MSQVQMSHVIHINEPCNEYEWVMSDMNESCHMWLHHVTHMNESCHTYKWDMSRMNEDISPMNKSCHTYEWVMSNVNESCHPSMHRVIHMHEQYCLWVISHTNVMYESHIWIMSHMNPIYESCHICISHMDPSLYKSTARRAVMSHIWMWNENWVNETYSYVWHDVFLCVTWRIHMCDMTYSYVWHDVFICVTWREDTKRELSEGDMSFVSSLQHTTRCITLIRNESWMNEALYVWARCNTLKQTKARCNTHHAATHTTLHHIYMERGWR